ncbi:MAG TPA: SGNH/GDSL hydrolase family protein [Thermomicrobiales bacterium]|nr:SGNH/GDSL hydrolase family protein [Thermomicrobiales bacterium]
MSRNDKRRYHPTAILVLVVTLLSATWPVAGARPVGAQPSPEPMLYLALGDSYASGQGLDDRGPCRQSDEGYPYHVRDGLPVPAGMRLLACGGTTARPNDIPGEDLMTQVAAAWESMDRAPDRIALVTISVGINDFQVADELLGRLADPDRTYDEFTAWVDAVLPETAGWVGLAIDELLVSPTARIVLVTYPNPVPWTAAQCEADDCYRRASYVFDRLNAMITAEADPALPGRDRVAVTTGLAERFRGHDCLAVVAGSWFQTLGSLAASGLDLGEFLGVDWSVGDCAHPNADGARVIAEEVLAAAAPLLADATGTVMAG